MGWVDLAIVALVIGSAMFGLARGLIVQVGAMVGVSVGLYLARNDYAPARDFLGMFFHRDAHLTAVSFALVFLLIWALCVILAQSLRRIIRFTPFGLLDRVGGAVLGIALGIITVELLLILASDSHDASLHASIHASRLAPMMQQAIPGLKSVIPKNLPLA
jgi:membrane protein required for colicin V production